MMYDLETVGVTEGQEPKIQVAGELKIRFSLGVTRLNMIRNEYITGSAQLKFCQTKLL